VVAYQADIQSKASTEAVMIDRVVAGFGRIDVVVANSGICSHVDALNYTEEEFRRVIDVNLNGAFWTAKAAAELDHLPLILFLLFFFIMRKLSDRIRADNSGSKERKGILYLLHPSVDSSLTFPKGKQRYYVEYFMFMSL
jgi:NAD(P)-dependent dehydrogenase (short-subunit alcohol dehydrogenase family)